MRDLIFGVGNALEHIHGNGVVMRALDAQGILMTETVNAAEEQKTIPRIVRFDNAVLMNPYDEFTRGCFGDIRFRAPEVLQNKSYTASADSWSFGVIAFFVLTGKLPFDENKESYPDSELGSSVDDSDIEERIINNDPPIDLILKSGHC